MALQPVFKRSYIEHLRTHIRPTDYMGDHFEYDRSQVVRLYGITKPEDLLQELDPSPDGDYKSAIAIYEAYKDITPLFAQQDDLWVYLTHVDLFEYVKRRWPIKNDDDKEKQIANIQNHWFRHGKHLFRTPIAGLWWQVFLTKDEDRDNPYELTEVYFNCGQDFHQRFGELTLIRHREAMVGVLEFLKDHPELTAKGFDPRGQYISRLFNSVGSYKLLSNMDKDYFKKTLEDRLDIISQISNRTEVQNQDISLNE
jgi:hypothetical protein